MAVPCDITADRVGDLLSELFAPLAKVDLLVFVGVTGLHCVLDVDDLVSLHVQLGQHLPVALLDVVSHFELVRLVRQFGLHLRVAVVDDGEEHVEEDEEDEEDVEDEVGGSKHSVCLLQFVVVEISEDDSEKSEAKNNNKR